MRIILILLILNLTSSFENRAQMASAIDHLIKTKGSITQVASGFSFTEGPAVNSLGEVYFTDQPNNKIYRWQEPDQITEWEVDGERANGLYFLSDSVLIACADYRNKLIGIDKQGNKTVLVEGYQGKYLNGPNDLWIHPNGNIYFSDSYYHRPWWPEGHEEVQDQRSVYCFKPNGDLMRVAEGFEMPNGLIGTPDGKQLYISDIRAKKIWKYTIEADGRLAQKTFFAPEGSDGMTIDNQGNVYLTNSVVSVFSAKGDKLGEIEVPERPSNVCFGGKNRQMLFITAQTSVYSIAMRVKGVN